MAAAQAPMELVAAELGSADRERPSFQRNALTQRQTLRAAVLHPGSFSRARREFVEEHEERFLRSTGRGRCTEGDL